MSINEGSKLVKGQIPNIFSPSLIYTFTNIYPPQVVIAFLSHV